MEITTEIEAKYVVKMTRLEAARFLVDPKEVQAEVRTLLRPGDDPEIVTPAKELPKSRTLALAPRSSHSLPSTRKAMRKLRHDARRVACPQCGKMLYRRGLNVHIARKHRRNGVEPAAEIEAREEAS